MMMMSMYCNNVLSTDMICSDQCSWTLAEWWLMIMMMMGRTSLISTLHEYKRTWFQQTNCTSCSNKLDIFATDIVKLEIFIKSSLLGRNLDISKSAVNTSLDKKTESLFGNITFILLTCPVSDTHHTWYKQHHKHKKPFTKLQLSRFWICSTQIDNRERLFYYDHLKCKPNHWFRSNHPHLSWLKWS